MDNINLVIKGLLLLSNDYILMSLATLFYISSKKDNAAHLILLLLFSMIYKTMLKDVFKLPAPITSPTTNFGFPSGHINFAVIFYGWFVLTIPHSKLLRLICPLIVGLTGWSMVYIGYHYPIDVILTPILALSVLDLYKVFLIRLSIDKFANLFLAIAVVLHATSMIFFGYLKCDTVIGCYGILGFVSAIFLTVKKLYKNILLVTIGLLIFYAQSNETSFIIRICSWFLLFGTLPVLRKIVTTYRKKITGHRMGNKV